MSLEDQVPVGDLVPVLVLAVRLKGEDLGKERLLPWPVSRMGKRNASPHGGDPVLFILTPWESLEEQPTWYCERVTSPTEAKEPQQPADSLSLNLGGLGSRGVVARRLATIPEAYGNAPGGQPRGEASKYVADTMDP